MQTDHGQFRQRNTVPESCEILRISRPTFYDRVRRGLIRVVKDGGRSFVTGAELTRYMAACESAGEIVAGAK